MLLQKYEPELVDEIMDYINQKKDGFDELPERDSIAQSRIKKYG